MGFRAQSKYKRLARAESTLCATAVLTMQKEKDWFIDL